MISLVKSIGNKSRILRSQRSGRSSKSSRSSQKVQEVLKKFLKLSPFDRTLQFSTSVEVRVGIVGPLVS